MEKQEIKLLIRYFLTINKHTQTAKIERLVYENNKLVSNDKKSISLEIARKLFLQFKSIQPITEYDYLVEKKELSKKEAIEKSRWLAYIKNINEHDNVIDVYFDSTLGGS